MEEKSSSLIFGLGALHTASAASARWIGRTLCHAEASSRVFLQQPRSVLGEGSYFQWYDAAQKKSWTRGTKEVGEVPSQPVWHWAAQECQPRCTRCPQLSVQGLGHLCSRGRCRWWPARKSSWAASPPCRRSRLATLQPDNAPLHWAHSQRNRNAFAGLGGVSSTFAQCSRSRRRSSRWGGEPCWPSSPSTQGSSSQDWRNDRQRMRVVAASW